MGNQVIKKMGNQVNKKELDAPPLLTGEQQGIEDNCEIS